MFGDHDHGGVKKGGITILGAKEDIFSRNPSKEEDGIFQLFSAKEDLVGTGIGLPFRKKDRFIGSLSGDITKILKDRGFFLVVILIIEMVKCEIDLLFFWRIGSSFTW